MVEARDFPRPVEEMMSAAISAVTLPASVHHTPRVHAACRTDEYLYHQLIPYIGNKRKLLPLLGEALKLAGIGEGTFLDLFAGSGVVSRLAKQLGYRVLSNDWEPYAYVLNVAYVECNHPPQFRRWGGADALFHYLNALPPVDGYIATHYCPEDDERPDPDRERLFFTRRNGRRIDAIREQVAAWEREGLLDERERAFILAPLVYSASYVSNTSGLFKGFHRGWGGATRTALYRILSDIRLSPPLTLDNGEENLVFREDAGRLAEHLRADIAYLDPPYNQHPYGSNYHLLNTLVLWDKPAVSPRIDEGIGGKSAIRTDWRTERRSAFTYRHQAADALATLVSRLCVRRILMSYSTEGLLPVEQVMEILGSRGPLQVLCQPYKRYRVSSQRYSPRPTTIEYVVVVDCERRNGGVGACQAAEQVRALAAETA